MTKIAYLTPPNAESRQFGKNFIDNFVVEFRFPALLEISQESQVVATVQKAVREKFPIYNNNLSANLTPVGMSHEVSHEFRDKTQKSVISLSNTSVTYSTRNYTSFSDAIRQCEFLIETVVPHLQTNYFTRVGMRYINKLSIVNSLSSIDEWINKDVVKVVSTGVLGTLSGFKVQYDGSIDEMAKYLFRCGIADNGKLNVNSNVSLVLDYDYSRLDVDVDSALQILGDFHDKHFSFFWWCLGEKAKEDLKHA